MTAPPILEFVNPIFLTGPNITVRRGDKWHGAPQARLRLADGSLSPPVALHTELKRFDRLNAADLACEHDPACRTPAGLLAVLQQIYPGFSADEEVTVCHFQWP